MEESGWHGSVLISVTIRFGSTESDGGRKSFRFALSMTSRSGGGSETGWFAEGNKKLKLRSWEFWDRDEVQICALKYWYSICLGRFGLDFGQSYIMLTQLYVKLIRIEIVPSSNWPVRHRSLFSWWICHFLLKRKSRSKLVVESCPVVGLAIKESSNKSPVPTAQSTFTPSINSHGESSSPTSAVTQLIAMQSATQRDTFQG